MMQIPLGPLKKLRHVDRQISLGYVLIVAILIAIGFVNQKGMNDLVSAVGVRGSLRTANEGVEEILSDLKDIETGQRGYLLTGNDNYLTPYRHSIRNIEPSLKRLVVYRTNEQRDTERADQFTAMIREKIAEMAETVRLKQSGRSAEALKIISTDRGRVEMNHIRDLHASIVSDHMRLIHEQTSKIDSITKRTKNITMLGSGLATILVLFAAVLLEWYGRRRRQLHEKITATNAVLQTQKVQLADVVSAQFALATADLDTKRVMDLVIRHAQNLTGSEGSVIELVEGDQLVYHVASGVAAKQIGMRIPLQGSFSGLALRTKKALLCRDSETDDRVNREACRKSNVRSMIALPLFHRETTIGVLKVYSSSVDRFGTEQMNVMELIGGILSATLGQAREFDDRQKAIVALHNTEKELTAAKNLAETATLAKSMLLANVSHEVRTPINGILGMASILLDTPMNSEQRDYARTILQSGETLLEIVNDILDLSKTEAGKLSLEQIDFDIVSTLQDLVKPFKVTAGKKNVRVNLSVGEGLPNYVKGDPGRLRQILSNLVSNAVKFTTVGTVIIRVAGVKSLNEKLKLRFEVEDSGMGMDPETLAKIFQPFTQADISTTRKFGGTGLGLSICKKLVDLMDGEIGVKSTLGKGSTFWFDIQLKPSEAAMASRVVENEVQRLPFAPHTRILVAEDNPINQKVALKQLEKMGLQGHAVGNGLEAIQALRTIPYSLVLMDCQMPEMDGYAAATEIKKDSNLKQIPIVAMTASAVDGERERCLNAGMDDYVTKPIKLAALQAIIGKWLIPNLLPKEADMTTSPADSQVLDPDVLAELRALDIPTGPTLIEELGTLFMESLDEKLAVLHSAFDRGDGQAMEKLAHQMKSSSGNIGAMKFSQLFSEIEDAVAAGRNQDLPNLIQSIDRESRRVMAALRVELERAKSA